MGWIRRLYDWVAGFADSRHADLALFLLAFVESSFFPIPPDVLLIALAFARPRRAFRYAMICTAGSVLGGAFGYFLGHTILQAAAVDIAAWLGMSGPFARAGVLYQEYDVWAVGIAAFTVIPYKVFTILAGMFHLDFWWFMVASLCGRGGRFLAVSAAIYFIGPRVRPWVERHLEWIALALVAAVVIGFLMMSHLGPAHPEASAEELSRQIAALASDDLAERRQASHFLLLQTDVWFGYNPSGPEEERQEAIRKWSEWYRTRYGGTDPPGKESGPMDEEGR